MPCGGRYGEQRREGARFDRLFVGHEFQQTQPAVAAAAVPAAADSLSVERHLGYAFAGGVLIHGKRDAAFPFVGIGDMPANDHADIFCRIDELFEDTFAGVAAIFAQNILIVDIEKLKCYNTVVCKCVKKVYLRLFAYIVKIPRALWHWRINIYH